MIQQVNRGDASDILGGDRNVRVVLMLASPLDCEAILALFEGKQQIGSIEALSDIELGMACCGRLLPHVLVVDPKVGVDVLQRAEEAIQQRHVGNIIILDDHLHEGRLAAILNMPTMSYLTRQSGFPALLAAVIRVATLGSRVFDPAFADRIQRTSRGWRLQQDVDRPSVAALTSRELEVMKLLARGFSVRDCAAQLNLAESTIDNHKSRLMKKLNVHKAAEITQVAIRDGLIMV